MDHSPDLMATLWQDVKGRCAYSRLRSGDFGNDEFLCINPFHYERSTDIEIETVN
jgi:hypothetical protein